MTLYRFFHLFMHHRPLFSTSVYKIYMLTALLFNLFKNLHKNTHCINPEIGFIPNKLAIFFIYLHKKYGKNSDIIV